MYTYVRIRLVIWENEQREKRYSGELADLTNENVTDGIKITARPMLTIHSILFFSALDSNSQSRSMRILSVTPSLLVQVWGDGAIFMSVQVWRKYWDDCKYAHV